MTESPTPAPEVHAEGEKIRAITDRSVTPDTLRILAASWEPMRGTVIASGDIEDGTDTSVGAGILIDGMNECADAWVAERKHLAALEMFVRVRRDVDHALFRHAGDRETCKVGPCGPANEYLVETYPNPAIASKT